MKVSIDDHVKDKLIREVKLQLAKDSRDFDTPVHLSDLTRCITKSFWSRLLASSNAGDIQANADAIDDRAALFMYIGVMSEAVLERLAPEQEVRAADGVIATPDWKLDDDYIELKTTRIYVRQENKVKTYPSKGFPSEWVRRMAGYCRIYMVDEWRLGMMLVVPGDIMVYRFEFDRMELLKFWLEFIGPRNDVFRNALRAKLPPKAFRYNDDWECGHCTFKMLCDYQSGDHMSEEQLNIELANADYLDRADVGISPIEPEIAR